jgi:arylsulfatase A-like enzyme
VRYVDDRVGRIISLLKELDLYEETLIVLTSDHGDEFWDHDGMFHGHTLYEELLRVPLTIKLPSSEPVARRNVADTVSTVSLTPTLLETLGIDAGDSPFSEASLRPLWSSAEEPSGSRDVFAGKISYFHERFSVIHDGWKYIWFPGLPKEELYHLETDPAEQVNLASVETERKQELGQILERHHEESKILRKYYGVAGELDAAEQDRLRDQLKSLGYIQ